MASHGTNALRAHHYEVGAAVAIRTDEAPFPHLGIIKKVDLKNQMYDILWLYRIRDCGADSKPPKPLLRCPCSYEWTRPGDGESIHVNDPGDLKEVFFSAHAGSIKPETIIHEVQVLFLGSNADASTLAHLQLLPGLICRHVVDPKDGSFYPLKPSVLVKAADGELLSALLQASDKRLKRILSDMSQGGETARPEVLRLHGKGPRD